MGVTIGNSLRRVLLSSLSGFALTKVSIGGVQHEFSSIPNVVEDTLDVISNLKSLVFTSSNFDEKVFTLSGKGKGVLKASDIKLDGATTIVNEDTHILEMSSGANVSIEITVSYGSGYQLSTPDSDLNSINTDSSFSPVVKVNHFVENIRVGKEMGYDSLVLDVCTNGSVAPDVAVGSAVEHLVNRLSQFTKLNEKPELDVNDSDDNSETNVQDTAMLLTVDDLELSARSSNCLKRAGIQSVSELIKMDMSELIQIKNFGKKSAEEINSKLSQYDLSLKGSVEDFVK